MYVLTEEIYVSGKARILLQVVACSDDYFKLDEFASSLCEDIKSSGRISRRDCTDDIFTTHNGGYHTVGNTSRTERMHFHIHDADYI